MVVECMDRSADDAILNLAGEVKVTSITDIKSLTVCVVYIGVV